MAEEYRSLHPVKYYRDHIKNSIRPDGRRAGAFRPVIVNSGSFKTADGSALVKIGNSIVVCGIKAELCKPKAATPNEGFIVPNVDLPPLCSPKFKPGPPSDQAQVYTQLLANVFKNSGCVDLKDLCIFPDKLAWCLFVDVICLNFDGSIFDASVIAAVTALKTVLLPSVEYDAALDNTLVNIEDKKPLTIHSSPVCTTFAIFDDKILLQDPTSEEESLCTGILNIVLCGDDICLMNKPGGSPLSDEDIFSCIEISKSRSKIVNDLVTTALNSS